MMADVHEEQDAGANTVVMSVDQYREIIARIEDLNQRYAKLEARISEIDNGTFELTLASEQSLAKDWLSPEEDAAWADLLKAM